MADRQIMVTRGHMRGSRVAGVGSRVYWCNPKTGLLHLCTSPTAQAPRPGVHPDCAERLLQFPGYEVGKAPPAPPRTPTPVPAPPPAPTPPRPPVREEAALAAGGPSAGASPPDSAATEAGPPVAPSLPVDDALTIKGWLAEAERLNLGLTEAEIKTRPKAKLVSLIRDKAAALE